MVTLWAWAMVTTAQVAPNVLFFLVDDLGYMDVGANHPGTFYETPHIDRLAAEGMRFTHGYAANPVCSPTRYSIMTGKYPTRAGATQFFSGKRSGRYAPAPFKDSMALSEITLAEAFKEAGYATFFAGKWHLGPNEAFWPEHQGFDVNRGGWKAGAPFKEGKYFTPYANPRLEDGPPGEHLPERLASETIDFMEAQKQKPFLAYVSFYSVHTPLMAPAALVAKYREKARKLGLDRQEVFQPEEQVWPNAKSPRRVRSVQSHATYAAMVEEMDLTLVDVLDALEQTGELQNTYIIFTSDNGGGYAENRKVDGGIRRFNGPLQEGKRSIFEGGIRVPTVISGPGIRAGSQCDVPIVQWDFLPTFHDLSGSESSMPPNVDGGSLRQVFEKGNKGKVKRVAPGIIHHYTCHYHPPISSIIIGDYKLMRQLNSGEFLLFNLKTDYREEKNLASSMPEKVKQMDEICRKYVKKVKGGTAEQVRQAHHKLMDHFGQQSIAGYRKKLSDLKEQKIPDFEDQKAKMLKDLNEKLFKNLVNKEKTNLHRNLHAWREGTEKNVAEQNARAKWVEFTD